MKILFSTLLLSANLSTYAKEPKKEFYYMGAGGEPKGETTIFDGNIKRLSNFVKNSGWSTTYSVNGGHSKTEQILNNNFGNAKNVGSFTEDNYKKIIDEITRKLESGELSEGDQLMVMVDTHGSKKKDEKTHRISLQGRSGVFDYASLSGTKTVDLDPFEKIAELAAKKKIKLALIDMSCYSGNLLNIKNENVCLISASSPDHPAVTGSRAIFNIPITFLPATFSGNFIKNMKPKKNLEDLFLTALDKADNYKVAENPRISTPEGMKIYDLLHEKLKSFYFSNSDGLNDFNNQYENHENLEDLICKNEDQYQELKKLISQASQVASDSRFKKLNQKLENYREYQRAYERLLLPVEELDKKLKAFVLDTYPDTLTAASSMHVIDYLLNDPKLILEQVRNEPIFKNLIGRIEDAVKVYDAFKATLTKEDLDNIQKVLTIRNDKKTTEVLAGEVSDEVKKLYAQLYKEYRTEKTNPCRDFTL